MLAHRPTPSSTRRAPRPRLRALVAAVVVAAACMAAPAGSSAATQQAPVSFRAFDGHTETLVPWQGDHVTVLVEQDRARSATAMSNLVAGLDRAYAYYADVTGREPDAYYSRNGRDEIAEVSTTSCHGAACGYLGNTGIEIGTRFFEEMYDEVAQNNRFNQIPFYELGRNFWFYSPQLEFASPDSGDSVVTGFAVLMRFQSMDAAGVTPAPFDGTPFSTFRAQVEGLAGQYESDPSKTFAGTLARGRSPGAYGGTDFWASLMMQLAQRHGGQEFLRRFFHTVGSLPEASTTAEAVANWERAASAAACVDLGPVFYTRWGFPRRDGTVTARPSAGSVPEPQGSCAAPPARPVANNADGRQQLFLIGDSGELYTRPQSGGGWADAMSLGGSWPVRDSIAVGRNANGRLQVFLVGRDHELYTKSQTTPGGGWQGDWQSLGGSWSTADSIVAARNDDGRLQVYLVGDDHELYTNYQTSLNGGWSGWVSLGGSWPNIDSIGWGRNADGGQVIYLIGNDNRLYAKAQTEANGSFGDWTSLGGSAPNASAIGVGRNADGRQQVWLVGWNHVLYTKVQAQPNGDWSSWRSARAFIPDSDAIGVGQNADGRMQLYVVGYDHRLYTSAQVQPNGGWSNWSSLGGSWRYSDAIGVGRNADGRQVVYLTGYDRNLYAKYQPRRNGGFVADWLSLGGPWPAQ